VWKPKLVTLVRVKSHESSDEVKSEVKIPIQILHIRYCKSVKINTTDC